MNAQSLGDQIAVWPSYFLYIEYSVVRVSMNAKFGLPKHRSMLELWYPLMTVVAPTTTTRTAQSSPPPPLLQDRWWRHRKRTLSRRALPLIFTYQQPTAQKHPRRVNRENQRQLVPFPHPYPHRNRGPRNECCVHGGLVILRECRFHVKAAVALETMITTEEVSSSTTE